jgi:hypothetical protein
MSRSVPADEGDLCAKAAVFGAKTKETLYNTITKVGFRCSESGLLEDAVYCASL